MGLADHPGAEHETSRTESAATAQKDSTSTSAVELDQKESVFDESTAATRINSEKSIYVECCFSGFDKQEMLQPELRIVPADAISPRLGIRHRRPQHLPRRAKIQRRKTRSKTLKMTGRKSQFLPYQPRKSSRQPQYPQLTSGCSARRHKMPRNNKLSLRKRPVPDVANPRSRSEADNR